MQNFDAQTQSSIDRVGALASQNATQNFYVRYHAKEARRASEEAKRIEKNLKRKFEDDTDDIVAAYDDIFDSMDSNERFDEANAQLFLNPKSHKLCAFITARGTRCKTKGDSLRHIEGLEAQDPDYVLNYCVRHVRMVREDNSLIDIQLEHIDRILARASELKIPTVQPPPVQRVLHDLPPRALPEADDLLRDLGIQPLPSPNPSSSDLDSAMDIDN